MIDSSEKFWRILLGYSQRQLAERLGVSHASVSRWERGLWEWPTAKRQQFNDLCRDVALAATAGSNPR